MKLTRRNFLASSASAAGGLLIALRLGEPVVVRQVYAAVEDPFDAWIHIAPDGHAELVLNKSEMGQGVYTALPMMLAEEAEMDWERVSIVQSENSVGTGGSGSVYWSYKPLRQAGAVVREVMIATAAQQWGVPVAECFARKSQVFHRRSNRLVTYGNLVSDARRMPLPDPRSVRLKDRKDFTLLGRSIPHLDIPDKVQGKACYGIDVRLPGMVYAVIAQCPTLDGTLVRFDASKSKAVPGVVDVFQIPFAKTGGEVAIVARTTWAALQGRKALDIQWKSGPHSSESTESLTSEIRRALDAPAYWSWNKTGTNADDIPAVVRLESVYEFPFLAHATMEPMNTTVWLRNGHCEVWAPTQAGDSVRTSIAKILGMPEQDVTVHVTFVGGGFGRRFGGEFERQAAQLAQKMNLPVQVIWSREDDFTHDAYRPSCMHRLRAGIDREGQIAAWSDRIADTSIIGQSDPKRAELFEVQGAVDFPYPSPYINVSYVPVQSGVPRGVWRGVPITFNVIAVECFIDEVAYAAKQDPYLFRRRLLSSLAAQKEDAPGVKRSGADWPQPDPRRTIAMLDLVTQKAGWGQPPGRNRGRGISCFRSVESYLAQVAEVTVEGGIIHVDRIITVADCGQVINMNGLKAQIEGGVLFGLSGVLNEKITVKNGTIQQENFNSYSVLRMPDAPELQTYIVESNREPGGIGEPPVALPGASVGNAIFAATGKRLRKLPFRLDQELV